jgi:hypothetical protein
MFSVQSFPDSGESRPVSPGHIAKGAGIMIELRRDILQCVGNTSLLPLRNFGPRSGSRILLKLEYENSTGRRVGRLAPQIGG